MVLSLGGSVNTLTPLACLRWAWLEARLEALISKQTLPEVNALIAFLACPPLQHQSCIWSLKDETLMWHADIRLDARCGATKILHLSAARGCAIH